MLLSEYIEFLRKEQKNFGDMPIGFVGDDYNFYSFCPNSGNENVVELDEEDPDNLSTIEEIGANKFYIVQWN